MDISLSVESLCSLLCLASLTEHHVFKVHQCCSMYQCFYSFSELNNIPLYGWATFSLSICQLMNIWVVSRKWFFYLNYEICVYLDINEYI